MTIVTNLVVALMIVSNGLERVETIVPDNEPINMRFGDYILHYGLGRKRAIIEIERPFTNFVFSTMIPVEKMSKKACFTDKNCPYTIDFAPGDFLGDEIQSVWFYHPLPPCPVHEKDEKLPHWICL